MALCRTIMSVLFTFIIFSSTAAANSFPHGCEVKGFGFDQNALVLNETGAQSFYLIQNRSPAVIELQRYETREVFMSPPLVAKFDPSQWSAFASDIQNLHFQCFARDNENVVPVSCRDVLEVCQYPRVKFALSNMGNYWVSVNKPQNQVINEATAKGIYLRW